MKSLKTENSKSPLLSQSKILHLMAGSKSHSIEVFDDGIILVDGYLKAASDNGNGYKTIALSAGSGRTKRFYVHRLVATAFLPNPNKLPQVNHINRVRGDNRVLNLEWVTSRQNLKHSFDQNVKLHVLEYFEILDRHYRRKQYVAQIAREMVDISEDVIRSALTGIYNPWYRGFDLGLRGVGIVYKGTSGIRPRSVKVLEYK